MCKDEMYLVDGEREVVVDGEGVVLARKHLLQARVQPALDLTERLQTTTGDTVET